MDKINQELFDLYDEYCHSDMSRRDFISKASSLAITLGISASVVQYLLPRYAEAQTVSFTDPRIRAEYITYNSPRGSGLVRAYLVRPMTPASRPAPGVFVIHENRGLNPHIEDVARRAAMEGFVALAPDGLSSVGGYPGNDDRGRVLQRQIDPEQLRQDMIAGCHYLSSHPDSTGRLGVTGFCWGGGMTNQLAVELGSNCHAAVPFYGSQVPASQVPSIEAPSLLQYAGNDPRINAGWPAYEEALKANGKDYTAYFYDETNHGFHNNSTPRYDEEAATLAWQRTMDFFRVHLS
jgi:carboxymethylenebutenolidase